MGILVVLLLVVMFLPALALLAPLVGLAARLVALVFRTNAKTVSPTDAIRDRHIPATSYR